MTDKKQAFHKDVTDLLIKQLKEGSVCWLKTWAPGDLENVIPRNPLTGKHFRGVNAIYLLAKGYSDPRWLTYDQALSLGGHVKRDEKSTKVQIWQWSQNVDKKDSSGNPMIDRDGAPIKESIPLKRPRLFYASVFNAEQIVGMPELALKQSVEYSIERTEKLLKISAATYIHDQQDKAYYSPLKDEIHLPPKSQFVDASLYCKTALLELCHWTGHSSRLNRDLSHPFGSDGYAREALRTEIASFLLGVETGIGHSPGKSSSYVKSWIKQLEQDPKEIFRASADATRIQDHILSFDRQQVIVKDLESAHSVALKEKYISPEEIVREEPVQDASLKVNSELSEKIRKNDELTEPKSFGKNAWVSIKRIFAKKTDVGTIKEPRTKIDSSLEEGMKTRDMHKDESGTASTEKTLNDESAGVSRLQGQVVDFGSEPYKHDENNKRSFFITLINADGEKHTTWGIDLKRAAGIVGLQKQDIVTLNNLGQQPVTIKKKVADDQGHVNIQDIHTHRNTWEILKEGPTLSQKPFKDRLDTNVPVVEPMDEFATACREAGLIIEGHPIMDGKKHRVKVEGDKLSEKSGQYTGYLDGHPAGFIVNYKAQTNMRWKSKGYHLSGIEKQRLTKEAKLNRERKALEIENLYENISVKANNILSEKYPLASTYATPYLDKKGLLPSPGIYGAGNSEEMLTVIPAMDISGKIWNLQFIRPDSSKVFLKDGKMEGCFHPVRGLEAVKKSPVIIISEGYATAKSVSDAMDMATVAAFNCGNLLPVAMLMRKMHPDKPIVIAGDNDHSRVSPVTGLPENIGKIKSKDAATVVKGHSVTPQFTNDDLLKGAKDFNDLANLAALSTVRKQVQPVIDKSLKEHKQLTHKLVDYKKEVRLTR